MEIESSPLTLSTSPREATRIMMLSLALIQSGKTLISAQYPGDSHHAEEKKIIVIYSQYNPTSKQKV